jgi:hypothetical protein
VSYQTRRPSASPPRPGSISIRHLGIRTHCWTCLSPFYYSCLFVVYSLLGTTKWRTYPSAFRNFRKGC